MFEKSNEYRLLPHNGGQAYPAMTICKNKKAEKNFLRFQAE